MKKILFALLSLFVINAYAEIYVKQETNGDIVYSDVPMTNAKTVDLPQTNSQSTTTEEVTKNTATDTQQTSTQYKSFRITSPKDQETIQNQPSISVAMHVEPELQKNDVIQLFIDGKRVGQPTSNMQIETGLVERGSHELYALITDQNKRNKIQSNVITIYVMRARAGFPPGKSNPPPKAASAKAVKHKKASLARNR